MELKFGFFAFIIATTALVTWILSIHAWQRRTAPGGIYFSLLMAAVAFLAFCDAFELAATQIQVKITWSTLSYIGLVNIAPLWLMFAIHYSRQSARLRRRMGLSLWIIPAIILGLAITNDWHGLLWTEIKPLAGNSEGILQYVHGPAFWLHTVYAYALVLAGSVLLILAARRLPSLYRMQIAALIGGAVIPWIANLFYLFKINPWPGVDLAPLGFLVSGILIYWSINKYDFLNLIPVSREVLFNSLGGGVLILDRDNRLVDLNPTARRWTALGDEAIGQNVFDLLPFAKGIQLEQQGADIHTQLEIGQGAERRVFDLTISPLNDSHRSLQGRVVLVHDISNQQRLLNSEHRHAQQMELLNIITHAALSSQEAPHMYQILADRLGELFGADGAFLTLWNEDLQRVIPTAAYGELRENYPRFKVKAGENTLTQAVLESEHAIVIEDAYHSPHISQRISVRFPARSIMGLPLIARQKKLGAILISFHEQHHFTPEEISLGEQTASQIALAVIQVTLYDAEKRYGAQLTSLNSVSQGVMASLDLKQIFETVVQLLHQTFGYDYVSIYRLYGERLYLGAQVGHPTELVIREIPITRGIAGRTVRTRQPQFIPDVNADPDFLRSAYDIESEICVPLLKEQTVLGFLNVESSPHKILTHSDLQLLIAFAAQVSIAIDNARLFSDLQLRAEKERLLLAAIRDFTAGLDTDTVFQAIIHHMLNTIGADGCTISKWDRANDCVITLLDQNTNETPVSDQPGTQYSLQEYALTRHVLESRQGVFLSGDDLTDDPAERALMEKFGNEALLMLPLIIGRGQQVYGLIELMRHSRGKPFTENDLEMAQSILAQAAVAVENARLYAEKQRLATIDELTGLYNRRGLFELGRREVERALRFGHPLTALFMDIDHFKVFNDHYSYSVGDQVLRLLAGCLKANLREIDLIGRYGGDEFAVLLPETEVLSASEAAERVRQMVEKQKVKTEMGEVNVTISIGVCQMQTEFIDLETLLEHAGQILHSAKGQGKNRVMIDTDID